MSTCLNFSREGAEAAQQRSLGTAKEEKCAALSEHEKVIVNPDSDHGKQEGEWCASFK